MRDIDNRSANGAFHSCLPHRRESLLDLSDATERLRRYAAVTPPAITSRESLFAESDLIAELQDVREAVEELYLLLDHVCRNREELAGIFKAANVPPEISGTAHDATQAEEGKETNDFCCANPRIGWEGDSDYPGIVCRNCGFLAAENGSFVVRTEEELQAERNKNRQEQKELF